MPVTGVLGAAKYFLLGASVGGRKARMVTVADLRLYVVNLRRRADRRAHITSLLPSGLQPHFSSNWKGPFDGDELSLTALEATGHRLFPWKIDSDNPWWNRPLKFGEIGCTLSHLACWRHAATASEPFIVVLEDDAVIDGNFLSRLLGGLRCLTDNGLSFDLLYLGRVPLGLDRPAIPGFVSPGYSHCTFGYILTRRAVHVLLTTRLQEAIVPIDEFLPSLYMDHPRSDLRSRFPRQLTALAFDPPLAHQLPKGSAGSDTEDSEFVEN